MTFSIPHPCPVSAANGSGGFDCNRCHKKVTDFRNSSVADIHSAYVEGGGDICGIFSADMVTPASNKNLQIKGLLRRFLIAAAAVLLPLLVTPGLQASTHRDLSRDEYLPAFAGQGETIISGRFEGPMGIGLGGIEVTLLKGQQELGYAITRENGTFEISLPGTDYAPGELKLQFEKKKYRSVTFTVANPADEICAVYTARWIKKSPNKRRFRRSHVVGCPLF